MLMTVLRYILLFQGLLGIFIAGGVFFKQDDFRNRSIAAFIFLFGIEIFEFLFSTSAMAHTYPGWIGIYYFPIGFLYGPIFFLHLRSYLYGTSPGRKDAFHLLPMLIVIFLMWDMFMLPGAQRIIYMGDNYVTRILPIGITRALHIFCYGMFLLLYVRRHLAKAESNEKIYIIAMAAIYSFASISTAVLAYVDGGWRSLVYYYLFANSIAFFIGYSLYFHPEFLKKVGGKYLRSGLTKEEMTTIESKIRKAMDDQVFLDRTLTVQSLAEKVAEPAHRLSQVFSVAIGANFNEYVNGYRVEHAKKMLLDPKFQHYKIEAIAFDSGFNSKGTFHKSFHKSTNTTPKAFQEQHTNRIES